MIVHPSRHKYSDDYRQMRNRGRLFLLLCGILSILVSAGVSSEPVVEWEKTFGGSGSDWGDSVQQTSDGGYIISGFSYPYGSVSCDVYLVKTDSGGNWLWQNNFGISDVDQGKSVQQTSDGGYIIAGYTYSYAADSADVYLVKTNSAGNRIWQKTFGGTDFEKGSSVQQTSDNGYIITGYTFSYGANPPNVYLIKADSGGNSQWEKTLGRSVGDYGSSVQLTSDGGYIITGITYAYGTGGDVYLVKTDSGGNLQWEKTFGGSSNEYGESVQQTSNSGYIIAGSTYSYGAGSSDVYLVKLSPEPLTADLDTDGDVDFVDYAIFANNWMNQNCAEPN